MRNDMRFVREAMKRIDCNFQKLGFSSERPLSSEMGGILGVHLEGPFLNPRKGGGLDKSSFIPPTADSLNKLVCGYEDIVKVITLAPELPGCLETIERARSLGIKVNMGHSDATYQQALDGKNAGATGVTHIFNAMRPFHHREPGLAGLALLDPDLYIEVIGDGFHLHPATLKIIFGVKPLNRIILVSDTVSTSDILHEPVVSPDGMLLGSRMTLPVAYELLKDLNIPENAVLKACYENPARYLDMWVSTSIS